MTFKKNDSFLILKAFNEGGVVNEVGKLIEEDYPYFRLSHRIVTVEDGELVNLKTSSWFHFHYLLFLPTAKNVFKGKRRLGNEGDEFEYQEHMRSILSKVRVPLRFVSSRDNDSYKDDPPKYIYLGVTRNYQNSDRVGMYTLNQERYNNGEMRSPVRNRKKYIRNCHLAIRNTHYKMKQLKYILARGEIFDESDIPCKICMRIAPETMGRYFGRRHLYPSNFICNGCLQNMHFECTKCSEVNNLWGYSNYFCGAFEKIPDAKDLFCDGCVERLYFYCGSCEMWKERFSKTQDAFRNYSMVELGRELKKDFLKSMYIDSERRCEKCSKNLISRIASNPVRVYPPSVFRASETYNEIKYQEHIGVEIELLRDADEYDESEGDLYGLPEGWVCGSDASLSDEHLGIELRSHGPLNGDNMFRSLISILNYIDKKYMWGDSSCGIHFHIDARRLRHKELRRILLIMLKMEEYMYLSLPIIRFKRKYSAPLPRHMNHWTESILRINDMKDFAELWYMTLSDVEMTTDKYNDSRYRGLNLHSRFLHGTIEFRYFPTRTTSRFIMSWLKFCLAVVHSSKKELNKDFKDSGYVGIGLEDYLQMIGEENLYGFFSDEKEAYREQHNKDEVRDYFNQ